MTQKDKNLLLKDLCARLPYGVKIVIQDTFKYSIVPREYHVLDVSNFFDIFYFNYKKFDKRMKKVMEERPNDIVIKPYLFPLSSMTEEQKEELITITNGKFHYMCGDINNTIPRKNTNEWGIDENTYINSIKVINILYIWLLKNHFDINELIPMGLAKDATNLNIY